MKELEALIGGIYIALLATFTRENRDYANGLLSEFAKDLRLPAYERQFYADLAETATMAEYPAPYDWLDDALTATQH